MGIRGILNVETGVGPGPVSQFSHQPEIRNLKSEIPHPLPCTGLLPWLWAEPRLHPRLSSPSSVCIPLELSNAHRNSIPPESESESESEVNPKPSSSSSCDCVMWWPLFVTHPWPTQLQFVFVDSQPRPRLAVCLGPWCGSGGVNFGSWSLGVG